MTLGSLSGACAGGEPDWEGTRASHDMLFLGCSVHHPAHGSIYIGFNPHHYAFDVAIPEAPVGSAWTRIADTALPAPNDFSVQAGALAERIQVCAGLNSGTRTWHAGQHPHLSHMAWSL